MTTSSGDQLTVIFDGTCGFCTATRLRIERWDRHHRLRWVPCQGVAAVPGEIRRCDSTVVSITPDGTIDTGAQAFARILNVVTGSRLPLAIATLPVLCQMLSLGYHGIALIRTRLPGVEPWCAQHPETCRPDDPSE